MINVMKIQFNLFAKLSFFVLTLILTACSTVVPVNVTTYHDFPAPNRQVVAQESTPKTYQFIKDKSFTDDLERMEFAKMISAAILKEGFEQANPAEFTMSFATGAPKSTIQAAAPVMNPFVTCFGFGGAGFCNAGGGSFTQVAYDIYRNTLEVVLFDNKTGKKVWQASAVSDSAGAPNLNALMPLLARAAFRNFPGESGKIVKVDFEVTKKKTSDPITGIKSETYSGF